MKVSIAKTWEHVTKLESEWKEDNAKGSALPEAAKNPKFEISSKSETKAFLMVHQVCPSFSLIFFLIYFYSFFFYIFFAMSRLLIISYLSFLEIKRCVSHYFR